MHRMNRIETIKFWLCNYMYIGFTYVTKWSQTNSWAYLEAMWRLARIPRKKD